jgi:phosphopantetheine--protein transferase-like protein
VRGRFDSTYSDFRPRARGWVERVCGHDVRQARRWNALTDEEQDEALSFVHRADGVRFVAARGLLRAVLSVEWSVNPKSVVLSRDAENRVDVTPPSGVSPLFSSISHAGDWVAVALAPTPVGIDVESLWSGDDPALVAKVCTPRERRILRALPATRRQRYFTRLWTRKEAVVKATGHRRPDLIDVTRLRVRGVSTTASRRVQNETCCGRGYELAWAAPERVKLVISAAPSL